MCARSSLPVFRSMSFTNGGLSSARNCGIEFALAAFSQLEAVYFLDCDTGSDLICFSVYLMHCAHLVGQLDGHTRM